MFVKIVTFVMIFALMLSLFSFGAVAYELDTSEADIGGYYLYNLENSLIMAESNTDALLSPSSTVKIMTACIALESNIPFERVVSVTKEMLSESSGRNMRLKTGDKITFEDLIYATVCGGYNDAAVVLALTVCDSIEDFLKLMNEKADALGMQSTVYLNVTGISAAGMTTSVADIARLAKYISENEKFVEIARTKYKKLSSLSSCENVESITNRSSLLASYRGLANFNTGSGDGGDNTVLYYNIGELSFICIVMNANGHDTWSTENYAELYSKKLLSHAVNDYSNKTVLTQKNAVISLPVKYSTSGDDVDLYPVKDLTLFISDEIDPTSDITYSTHIYGTELKAPLRSGDIVGELVVSYDGKILASVFLEVRKDVDKNTFLYILELMRGYVGGRAFIISVFCFAIMMLSYYVITKRKLNKMYKGKRAPRRRPTKQ